MHTLLTARPFISLRTDKYEARKPLTHNIIGEAKFDNGSRHIPDTVRNCLVQLIKNCYRLHKQDLVNLPTLMLQGDPWSQESMVHGPWSHNPRQQA